MTADLCLSHGRGHVTCCAQQAQPLHQVSVKKLMVCSGCKMFSVVLNPVDYNKKGRVDHVFWAVCLLNRNGTDRVHVHFCH